VDDLPVEDALETWLQPGAVRINPAFPPALEAVYMADITPARLRFMRVSTMTGVLAGALLVPPLWRFVPDAHAAILAIWLGIALPAGLLCHAVLWTRLGLVWQERQTALAGVIVALAFTAVALSTQRDMETCFFGGLLLLVLLGVIAGAFSLGMSCAFSVAMTGIFVLGHPHLAAADNQDGGVAGLLFAVCCLFAVCGAWRLDTESRRSWALMLRERLKQRALADHNVALAELAQRDPLTGLANRRSYENAEGALWRVALDSGHRLGLIVIDIDRFKDYNDFYGHPAGDACLQAVARCLTEQSRGAADLVARVGGEEFAILLPALTVETAGDIAERVRQAVAAMELPHLGWGVGQIVTISCGACSLVPREGISPRDLFAAADAALYAAKQGGRNRVCLAEAGPVAALDPVGGAQVTS
jgi:diguanylate cyclase (GGDEF)-like protein